MVSRNSKQAILATVLYSNIFHFPLTKEEIWQFLISKKEIPRSEFELALEKLSQLTQINGFFCLKGRERIVKQRQKQQNEKNKKLAIAKFAAHYLAFIPSIQLIGISGSLAMGDAKKEDDIDFFIVTQTGTLWITRIWILAILEALNLRRKRQEKNAPDKICCNLLIEENNLAWPTKKRNIYTAHEIIQLKPLFERQGTYDKFLSENQWIKTYYPNAHAQKAQHISIFSPRDYVVIKILSYLVTRNFIKKTIETFQKNRMQKHKTKETISQNFLALHPHDYAIDTIRLYNLSLKKYGLLTNI